jgi:hypothetical protein
MVGVGHLGNFVGIAIEIYALYRYAYEPMEVKFWLSLLADVLIGGGLSSNTSASSAPYGSSPEISDFARRYACRTPGAQQVWHELCMG